MEHPLVSIVIPAYNAEATLEETLDATLSQTFHDFEVVVVDDGSQDGTYKIATAYATADSRIRVIHQNNMGTAGAYNTGVSHALGQLVTLCSADDLLYNNHLETMLRVVSAHPEYGIYASNGHFLMESGERATVYTDGLSKKEREILRIDAIKCCFYSVGAIYRRNLYDQVGGYRTDIYGEDYDFWLRLMAQGVRAFYAPEILSAHRVSATQKSANLVIVYSSDIKILTDFQAATELSVEENVALADSIAYRHKLISEVESGGRIEAAHRTDTLKHKFRALAGAFFGEHRMVSFMKWIRGGKSR